MTSLTTELAEAAAVRKAKRAPEAQAIMDNATQSLLDQNLTDTSLATGDTTPDFTLPNATGQPITLSNALNNGPVILAFYRGGWCPYCNLELRHLQANLPRFTEAGATLIAVSPQTPDNSLSTMEKNDLTFEVLSDADNKIARQFGLVFTLPEDLRDLYFKIGIDLPAANGTNTFELPIPATYVIQPDGRISYAFLNADYTCRADPDDIMVALTN